MDTTAGTRGITHVLVVDDDEVMRTTLRWPLEDAGYAVREATDGEAAVHILAQSAVPQVVLLDLLMPRMSGYELLRLLAGKPEWAVGHVFIVVTAVSGPFGPAYVQPLLAQLAITVVPKPFDLDELLAVVDAAAGRTAAVAAAANMAHEAPEYPAR